MDIRMSNIASPMPQIRAKFTNKLGIPLSGCKVYTYEPNSDIPKTTWVDIDKTVENTNPILLDAAGEADICLDGLYRIVVKDRFGFVVYDAEKTGTYIELDASLVVDANGQTQQQINDKTVKNGEYAPVLGSPVILKFNPTKASLLYGISDPAHLDDNLNNFRGLNNPDAYHDSNVAIGAVSFGRNNPPFAYLSFATGHDCVPFGVASVVGGAGSCTGNPDVPTDGANYGYCSLAIGKDTQARGRISNAMGHLNLSESRYSSTDGYGCIAGSTKPTHPNYNLYGGDGAEGAAARAHGFVSKAYGSFAFAYGSMLGAYNGSQVIGKGINEGSPLVISRRGLGLGYNVDIPTIFCQAGSGVNGAQAQIGFNTEQPISKYDFRFKNSEVTSYVIDNLGFGAASFDVVGLLNDGSHGSLYKVATTHANAGQPYGTTTFWQNNIKVMSMDEVGNLAISPKATANPTNNGDLVFELTSNTQLKVKVKGSDGVVRSATLTLA